MKQTIERGMNKVILVTRRTRLAELVQKYNTLEQARFYIEHLGADFSDYILEDKNYREAVKKTVSIAEKFARVQEVDRTFFPNLILGREDIVISDELVKGPSPDWGESRYQAVGWSSPAI